MSTLKLSVMFPFLQDFPGAPQDPREITKQQKNYLNLLKASAESDKPLYRMSKAEIDAELKRK